MIKLTAERLRQLVAYDPATGDFSRLVTQGGQMIGTSAGNINNNGRWVLSVGGKTYQRCRLAFFYMTGRWPVAEIDHINRNQIDDRWVNLREALHWQNMANRKAHTNNRTGLKGVTPRSNGTFYARIRFNGRQHHLGIFQTAAEAHAAYVVAAKKCFGEFARSA